MNFNEKIIKGLYSDIKGTECYIQGQFKNLDEYNDLLKNESSWSNYKVFLSANNYKSEKLYSLRLPNYICKAWANNYANENTQIVVADDKTNEAVLEILEKYKFYSKFNNFVERFMGLGIGATVLDTTKIKTITHNDGTTSFLKSDGEVRLNFIDGMRVYPITIEDGEITECAFVTENTNYTEIRIHYKNDNGNYNVLHTTYKEQNGKDAFKNIEIYPFNSPIPLFQIWQPNISKRDDIDYTLDTSILKDSIDAFKQCDMNYTMFYKELWLGKKVKFIKSGFINRDDNGNKQSLLDVNDESIIEVEDNQTGSVGMSEFNGELRTQQIISALNFNMNVAAMSAGLGDNAFSYDGQGSRPIQTATGIVAKQTELYRNVIKQENFARSTLKKMVLAIIWLNNTWVEKDQLNKKIVVLDENGNEKEVKFTEITEKDIQIIFDDNIMEDTASKKEAEIKEVQNGLMTVAEFRNHWYGEDLESAERFVHENGMLIDKYLIAYQSKAITEEQYVDFVFGKDCENREEIIKRLVEMNSEPTMEPFDEEE